MVNRLGPGGALTVTGRGLATSAVVRLELGSATCSPSGGTFPVLINGALSGPVGAHALQLTTVGAAPAVAPGTAAVCVQFDGTGSFVQAGSVVLTVAEVTALDPPAIAPLAGRTVGVSGSSMVNVDADTAAFVLATDCTNAATFVGSITTSAFAPASYMLSAAATGVAAGNYVLCVRWTPGSAYSATSAPALQVGQFCSSAESSAATA